jgi:hypothetical protein
MITANNFPGVSTPRLIILSIVHQQFRNINYGITSLKYKTPLYFKKRGFNNLFMASPLNRVPRYINLLTSPSCILLFPINKIVKDISIHS